MGETFTFNRGKAFTLAEVLITLAIIGVVAALTLPGLIANYQKTQYVTGLKKAYSVLSQVFKQYMADEGVTDLSQTKLFSLNENYDELDVVLKKYFRVGKWCFNVEVDNVYNYDTSCDIDFTYLGTDSSDYVDTVSPYFYTADGMAFRFELGPSADCQPHNDFPGNIKGMCIRVNIDINGKNPPNIMGRDIYNKLFVAPNGNIYAIGSIEEAQVNQYYQTGSTDGWENNSDYWVKNGSCGQKGSADITDSDGDECAARIIEEGWQMSY